jgi:hypothetical protein
VVASHPLARAAELRVVTSGVLTAEQILDSPFHLLGSTDTICDRLAELHDRHGISYFTVFDDRSTGFDAVVTRLS